MADGQEKAGVAWDEPGIAGHIDRYWETPGEILHRKTILNKVVGLLRTDDSILEVGCGSGHVYRYLKDLARVRYVGIDPSEEMLRLARAAHPQADFRKGHGQKLEFEGNSFDAVMSIDVFQHVPDVAGIVREMVRVSRRLVAFTISEAEESSRGFEIVLGQKFPWNRYSRGDAEALVREASGGLPMQAEPVGDISTSALWILRKPPTPGPG